jgi:hypothetical protein
MLGFFFFLFFSFFWGGGRGGGKGGEWLVGGLIGRACVRARHVLTVRGRGLRVFVSRADVCEGE